MAQHVRSVPQPGIEPAPFRQQGTSRVMTTGLPGKSLFLRSETRDSPSAAAFSRCCRSFPASGSFLMSQRFVSDGQSIGASASASEGEMVGIASLTLWT